MEDDLIFGGNNYETEKVEIEKYNGWISSFEQTLFIDNPELGIKFMEFMSNIKSNILRVKILSTKDGAAFRSMKSLSNAATIEGFQPMIDEYIDKLSVKIPILEEERIEIETALQKIFIKDDKPESILSIVRDKAVDLLPNK